MVSEEFVVIVRGHNGKGKRQFTYYVDPRKKPNAESVLRDFRIDSQITDEREWRLCTLTGKEIRWLTDYADRVLVLEPVNGHSVGPSETALLPRLGTPSPKLLIRNTAAVSNYEMADTTRTRRPRSPAGESPERGVRRPRPHHRSESSSIVSTTSSTPKLPSLSTSSSSGSNLLSSSGSGAPRIKDTERLPKARDSRPGYVERDNRNGKNDHASKRRERSR